ncbi:MAG: hypothetical protein HFF60_04300 [Oscillospiraceae bacterium]|jgi:DNA-binding MarR family transcriptional regulator|nr:hypothetical protein [Oscillospiraceae bacterium]
MLERFERFSLSLFELSRCWHKLASEEMSRHGLRSSHATYLTTLLRCEEGITAVELGRLCSRDKSDVSRMIGILSEKGFVTKVEVDGSLYRGRWKLTETGRTAAEQVCHRASLAVEMAGGDLTEAQRAVFYEALASITANLKALSKEGLPHE